MDIFSCLNISLHSFDSYETLDWPKYALFLPPSAVTSDFIEMARLEKENDDENEDRSKDRDKGFNESPQASPIAPRHSRDDENRDESQLMINTSTLSAPEVSLVPSPDVSKVGNSYIF